MNEFENKNAKKIKLKRKFYIDTCLYAIYCLP